MKIFDWTNATTTFTDFGGTEKTIHVPKTGLPFFDTLRLYGAIDLFLGLQQEITISDRGNKWKATGRVRENRLKEFRPIALILQKGKLRRDDEKLLEKLDNGPDRDEWPIFPTRDISAPLDNPDSALKRGIRNDAALDEGGLESGAGKAANKAKIPFIDALLAFAGQKRIETIANIYFLPVFEGKVDISKVVSPLRAWLNIPNVFCAQVLTLLALKTSLFADGYAERLSAVVYNTNLDDRGNYNYSGIIQIESTALGQRSDASPKFVDRFYRIFRKMVGAAWNVGKTTDQFEDALAHAHWLMQPSHPKHLSSLVTSIERQKRKEQEHIIAEPYGQSHVKEIFHMSYGKWNGDQVAVRKFAKSVSSAIYQTRQLDEHGKKVKDDSKKWYDEVTRLRSAPTKKAFFERALILIEQGKRKSQLIGSTFRSEDFDPARLMESAGENRSEFETFRDLFRMYLIQESTPKSTKKKEKNDE